MIEDLGLSSVVELFGYMNDDRAAAYSGEGNKGVSYITKTNCCDVQPPTKTFEYLLSGMPSIATATQEKRRAVSSGNGADRLNSGRLLPWAQLHG